MTAIAPLETGQTKYAANSQLQLGFSYNYVSILPYKPTDMEPSNEHKIKTFLNTENIISKNFRQWLTFFIK